MAYSEPIHFASQRYKVNDLHSAKQFYSLAFGMKPYFDEPTWVVFEIENYQLWLEPDDPWIESVYDQTDHLLKDSRIDKITFWAVEDVEMICKRFTDQGGSIERSPTSDGPFTIAVVQDMWGNKIGLHSRKYLHP